MNSDDLKDGESREILGEQFARRFAIVSAAAATGIAVIAITLMGIRINRIETSRHTLDAMGAKSFWQHESFDSPNSSSTKVRSQIARWLGDSTVSGISVVSINDTEADDAQLEVLQEMDEVRSLDLRSDAATDNTLAVISRLPNLRYLTVVGSKFTIRGLLQLRKAEFLRRLCVDRQQLTPMELAVLSDAIPSLQIADLRTLPPEPSYPRRQPNWSMIL